MDEEIISPNKGENEEAVQSGLLRDSNELKTLGLGSKFGLLKGTEIATKNPKKRYSYGSDNL